MPKEKTPIVERNIDVLSLGAGVQSSVMLLMAAQGFLPKPDIAIYANTQWDSKATYAHLAWLEAVAANAGIEVVRVTAGSLFEEAFDPHSPFVPIPLHFRASRDPEQLERQLTLLGIEFKEEHLRDFGGKPQMLRRQCTRQFKLAPLDLYIKREILGLEKYKHVPKGTIIRKWLGITTDEIKRVRGGGRYWERFVYPFCGLPDPMLDRPYNRAAVIDWYRRHYPDRPLPPKSACNGCPLHSNKEWREIANGDPDEWAAVVAYEKRVQQVFQEKEGITVYLHGSCEPIDSIDFSDTDGTAQLGLWQTECQGHCGV